MMLEERAIACITEHRGPEWATPKMVRAMLAFAAEERERCARVAETVSEAQAEGWRRNPKSEECGGAIAANNTGMLAARAIRNQDQGQ